MVFSRRLALHDCWERIFCRALLPGEVVDLGVLIVGMFAWL
jgi:hypothetical protein